MQVVYNPIKQIINICINDQKDKLWPMMAKLGCSLKGDEKDLMSKALMKWVMQLWLPASSALLESSFAVSCNYPKVQGGESVQGST